jgi:hypothetical protein
MFEVKVTRRATLASLGGIVLLPALFTQSAIARRLTQPSGIRVDVTPLRENAGDPTAAWVERELPAALAQSMAGRIPSGGLIVRIDYLTLGPNNGAAIHSNSSWDNISGVAIVGGRQIPVRATSSYLSSPVDQTMIEQSNHDRVSALVQVLAQWIGQGAFF